MAQIREFILQRHFQQFGQLVVAEVDFLQMVYKQELMVILVVLVVAVVR
jgi:hypothetical protein